MNARMKEMPPSKPKVNQLQRKFLQERLMAAQRAKEVADKRVQPSAVIAARKVHEASGKIIQKYDGSQWERDKRGRKLVSAAVDKVKEKILFGTPEEALAAVEAFESAEFSLK